MWLMRLANGFPCCLGMIPANLTHAHTLSVLCTSYREEGDEEEEEEEDDEEDRRMRRRKLYNYVDCDLCDEMGCFEEEEDRRLDEEEEDIVEYIEQFIECQQFELDDEDDGDNGDNEDEMEIFASWCCNSDGDGVRLCLYVDEECAVKYTGDSYYNLVANSNYANTYSNAKTELAYALQYPLSCAGEIEYDNPEEDEDEDQDEDEDEDEDNEAAEFCQELINNDGNDEEGAEVIALSTCEYLGDNDEEEEDEDEDEDEADYSGYDYWYQVEANDALNFKTLCYEIQNLNGEGYWTTQEYDESTYDPENDSDAQASFNGLSTGAEAAIAIVVLIAVAAIGFVAWKFASKKKHEKDDKEFHLVDDRKGSLA